MTTKEISKRKETAIAPTSGIKGLEGFDSELLIVPRLKIVQSLSDEAAEPHNVKVGSMVNNLTIEVLAEPKAGLKIVPLLIGKSRIMFKPMADGGGIKCMAKDNKTGEGNPGGDCLSCQFRQWGEDSKPPECVQFINIPVILPDSEELTPLMLSFGKSTFKAGRLLANLMAQKRVSPWNFMYELRTKYVQDDKGKYYIYEVAPAGKTDPELIEIFEGAYDMLIQEGYQTYGDELDEEIAEVPDAEVVQDADLEL